jgi:hypothetical protein
VAKMLSAHRIPEEKENYDLQELPREELGNLYLFLA